VWEVLGEQRQNKFSFRNLTSNEHDDEIIHQLFFKNMDLFLSNAKEAGQSLMVYSAKYLQHMMHYTFLVTYHQI
jgi:hypothetical protein